MCAEYSCHIVHICRMYLIHLNRKIDERKNMAEKKENCEYNLNIGESIQKFMECVENNVYFFCNFYDYFCVRNSATLYN